LLILYNFYKGKGTSDSLNQGSRTFLIYCHGASNEMWGNKAYYRANRYSSV